MARTSKRSEYPQPERPEAVQAEPIEEERQEPERGQRQSAPKPTMEEGLMAEARKLIQARVDDQLNARSGGAAEGEAGTGGVLDGYRQKKAVIDKEAIEKATHVLQKYKEGKTLLEQRIIEDEQWYKLRHWEAMRKSAKNMVQPTSAWLFNAIQNKHADAMDNFPEPAVRPREESDQAEAEMLSSILPVILEQNGFEEVYDEVWTYKLKTGTGVYGVFWDAAKNNIGDISITKVDLINLFWEPGITDIQKSRNLFLVDLVDNDVLLGQYPQLHGKLGSKTISVAQYIYDDTVDTTDKSVVVDWYYKKPNSQGKQILHFCKFVNDQVLFATENEERFIDRGFYDHGKYPFVFDRLFRVEGTPTGFGYIDVGKSAQEYIDRGNQAIMQNLLANTRPRHFIRNDGSVNEQEYADMTRDFVHVDGNLGQDSILPIQGKPLSDIYVQVINNKIDELKETTGNRDVSNGGTTGGVTAASGLAAMMEAGSKLSRDANKSAYRAFREICLMCIELIRQFYELPRWFRIVGETGAAKFVQYSNAGLLPQFQGADFGQNMGYRLPVFDIEVSAQKASPYSKLAQNELALQFYSAGFFNPQLADQALLTLEMMDFDGKDSVMQKIAQQAMLNQQMMMLGMQIAQQSGMAPAQGGAEEEAKATARNESLGGDPVKGREAKTTANARRNVAESTAPR